MLMNAADRCFKTVSCAMVMRNFFIEQKVIIEHFHPCQNEYGIKCYLKSMHDYA